jgi:hypothetical protein
VHRDRGRFDERSVVQPQVWQKDDQLLGAYVPQPLQGARVDPADPEVVTDVFMPARQAGQVPSR